MKRICSWCNRELDSGLEAGPGPDQLITHGICEACASKVMADIETVELYTPERHPVRTFRSVDFSAKLLGWPRPS